MLKQGGGIGDMIYADLTGTCDGNKNGTLAELADYKAGDPSLKSEIGIGRIPETDIGNIDKVLTKMVRYENETCNRGSEMENKISCSGISFRWKYTRQPSGKFNESKFY
jgi:hypothetical protein